MKNHLICHYPRHNLKLFVDRFFQKSKISKTKTTWRTMSFSRAAKRPRTNSASERNARITRKSSTSRARKPLYESNARVPVPRKRGRRDTITENKKGKITRKSTLSTARTRTTRPVRGAGAKRKSSKKPMPTTMSGMRSESKLVYTRLYTRELS